MEKLPHLLTYLTLHSILHSTPQSPSYPALRAQYIMDTPSTPLLITRPKNAEQVSCIVKYCVEQGIEFSVRSGGHDLYGRCFVDGAVGVDLRDLSCVVVEGNGGDGAEEGAAASIGGGILAGTLATELAKSGMVAASGSMPKVGYVGWASHGGYGPFVRNYGLGVDQILGAKVVNCEGKIVNADEKMLRAIRGGGGTVGVIVELRIKIYPLEKVLAGMVLFNSKDMATTMRHFTAGYNSLTKQGLHPALGIQCNVLNTPMGTCFAVGYMWSSPDLDAGRKYLDQICSFGQALHVGVQEMTVPEWMDQIATFAPKVAYGRNCTISVRELTEEVNEVISREVAKMPNDRSTLLSIHQLAGPSEAADEKSVFGARTAHYCLEFIATASEQERVKEVWEWAVTFRDALRKTDKKNILTSTYISLTPPTEASATAIYGENWEKLMEIKRQCDPKNVFKHALPKFPEEVFIQD